MLTPQQILEIADTLQPMIDELNNFITADMIRRIMARLGRGEAFLLTGTDQWQTEIYKSAGGHYEVLQQEIKRFTKKSDAEVAAIFEDAGIKAWEWDDNFYNLHGFESVPLLKSERMQNILNDAYIRTKGEIHNITRTTAAASQKQFIKILDAAYFKVISGAQSYTSAVKAAVNEIANSQTRVDYLTGHEDTLETAVMRAVRTGVAQASGNMTLQGMIERDWDLIRVSAHLGARYGDGGENPGNHFGWQGKLYSRTGKTKEYQLFVEATGYGTGEGLCGWNCRHSFGPGDPEHNPFQDFDAEENKRAYDLSQKQRYIERQIRKDKHNIMALQEAIEKSRDNRIKKDFEGEYAKAAELLTKHNTQYNTFCKENDLKIFSERLSVAKWSRSEAVKAAKAANSRYSEWSKSVGINTDPKSVAKYYDMKYNNPKENELFNGYTKAVEKGDISPLVGYAEYKNIAAEIDKKLIGTVTKDGIEIKSYTTHFIDRIIGQTSTPSDGRRQGVSIDDAIGVIKNGKIHNTRSVAYKGGIDERRCYINKNAKITISVTDKRIIQISQYREGRK